MTIEPTNAENGAAGINQPRRGWMTLPHAIYVATVILTVLGMILAFLILSGLSPASDGGAGFLFLLVVAVVYLGLAGTIIFLIPRRMKRVRSVVAIVFSAPAVYLWISMLFWTD